MTDAATPLPAAAPLSPAAPMPSPFPLLNHITEAAAIAAAGKRGRGDGRGADRAAVDAMRAALNAAPVDGAVVIGEGERDQAPMLYIGEKVGCGGLAVDIAVDPLECTDLAAKNLGGALSALAVAPRNGLLAAPDLYMEKVALGARWPAELADLDVSIEDRIHHIADIKGVGVEQVGVCMLDRPRHAEAIAKVRAVGAALKLIPDGDVAAVIEVADPESDIDFYIGIGGAPEGVLAAAALRCLGGAIQGRLIFAKREQFERAKSMRADMDIVGKLNLDDMVRGDAVFAATGVTGGPLLDGVVFSERGVHTHSLFMDSASRCVQRIRTLRRAEHDG